MDGRTQMNSRRHSFAMRLIWFSTAVVTVAVLLCSTVAYHQSKRNLKNSLASELLAVVNSVSPFIDGDLHEQVFLDTNGVIQGGEAFEHIRKQLTLVRDQSGLNSFGSPIYTLRKADDYMLTRDLEFVVMTDRNENDSFITGNRYPVQKHILSALEGRADVSGLYTDSEGVWISAAAPLYDSKNNVVGVIQADRHVEYFYQQARSKAVPILLTAIFSILIGSMLSIVWTRRLTNPIRRLVEANQRVGAGDLSTMIELDRQDEIGTLGESFNKMLEKLRSLQAQERSMASFAELNPAPVLSFNEKGEILVGNPSSARLFDRRQLIGLEVWELFAGLSKLDIRSTIREGRILNYSARIADRHYQFVIKGIPDLLVGQMYGSDVTELMQAQSEAARAKERAEVKARQLVETVKELKLFNKLSVDREMRMIQLKEEINGEYRCQGKLDKYNLREIKSLPAEIEV